MISVLAFLGISFVGSVEGRDGGIKSTQIGTLGHDNSISQVADVSNFHRRITDTRGEGACTGALLNCDGLGLYGGNAIIGDYSCAGAGNVHYTLCRYAGMYGGYFEVGNNSCLDALHACYLTGSQYGHSTVGHKSCKGLNACGEAGYGSGSKASIGNGSCVGYTACHRLGQLNPAGVIVGNKSCNGETACEYVGKEGKVEIVIGGGSCNCKNCCHCLIEGDVVPDDKCNSLGNGPEHCCSSGSTRSSGFDFLNTGDAPVNGVTSIESPSESPTESPSESPTPNPTVSMSPTFLPFSIGAAVSTLDDWSASKKLQISHKIGNGPGKVTVQLYSKDCSDKIPSLQLVSLSGDNFAASSLKYEIGMDFSKLSSSDYVVFDNTKKSKGTVFFCTHVQTYLQSNNNVVGELYLSSMKTNFQVKFEFDLTNVAFGENDIAVSSEIIADFDEETFDGQFTITACVCDAKTAVCATSPEAIAINSRVDLCLRPSSDEVEIENFSLTLKNGGVTYNPITIGSSGFNIDDEVLTEVTPVSNNLVIDQFLIAGLFSGNSNIILTGVANLNFVSGEVRTFSTFEMNLDIIVDQDDSVGCLNTALQGLMRLFE